MLDTRTDFKKIIYLIPYKTLIFCKIKFACYYETQSRKKNTIKITVNFKLIASFHEYSKRVESVAQRHCADFFPLSHH